ncbi:hypothetical protein GMST_14530 [Geomonas silvestris]|uniref:Uncharacterized protein n=1 Tax=Geomonas silvestris TaxID=2740184 RepID=A0A6V8MGM1_9BACT|nr:hypothetical protein GMST_14530 [Geomonas silvestris]
MEPTVRSASLMRALSESLRGENADSPNPTGSPLTSCRHAGQPGFGLSPAIVPPCLPGTKRADSGRSSTSWIMRERCPPLAGSKNAFY